MAGGPAARGEGGGVGEQWQRHRLTRRQPRSQALLRILDHGTGSCTSRSPAGAQAGKVMQPTSRNHGWMRNLRSAGGQTRQWPLRAYLVLPRVNLRRAHTILEAFAWPRETKVCGGGAGEGAEEERQSSPLGCGSGVPQWLEEQLQGCTTARSAMRTLTATRASS